MMRRWRGIILAFSQVALHGACACVEWLTVCTPPGCDASNSTTLSHARRQAERTGRIVSVLGSTAGGASLEIRNTDAPSRANKLRLVQRHLSSARPRCETVVFADASDVLGPRARAPKGRRAPRARGGAA